MTLFLQHTYVNNYILNGAGYLWWPNVLPGRESVSVLSKNLLNLEPPLCNPCYAPALAFYGVDLT